VAIPSAIVNTAMEISKMPLDPQVEIYLERLANSAFAQMHLIGHERVREGMRQMALVNPNREPVAKIEDRVIDTSAGELPIRIYHPAPGHELPVVVFFHGGGFALGDLDTHDGLARMIAAGAGCAVVSVDYPRPPEHKYPAAPKAAFAATQWVAAHGGEIGVDGKRIAVAGDSAGGNLATVVALMARDAGGPNLALQVLIYPDVDFRRSNRSIQEFAGLYGNISRDTQFWFMELYLNDEKEKADPLVSPLLSPNLRNLAPALIITAEYDALRDEGEEYGALLKAAGVDAEVKRYDGMIHEFLRWPFDTSKTALVDACGALRKALGT
jgi:acetyl esterase